MRSTLAAALRLPGRWRAVLGGRGVLAVEGADSRKFLQGLTTADVTTLDDHGPLYSGACRLRPHPAMRRPSAASPRAGMLDAKGRVLFDAFLIPAPDGAVLVDICRSSLPTLATHLKRYKLRAKVSVRDASDEFSVCVAPSADAAGANTNWADPRLPCLGQRWLQPAGSAPADVEAEAAVALYELSLSLLGVGQGVLASSKAGALPLESNWDLLGAVSFEKGCYLGQELTARTHFRGVTRKRLAPVLTKELAARAADADADACPPGLAHLPAPERRVATAIADHLAGAVDADADAGADAIGGKLKTLKGKAAGSLSAYDASAGVGLALCRLAPALGTTERFGEELSCTPDGAPPLALVPVRPSWWPAYVLAAAADDPNPKA